MKNTRQLLLVMPILLLVGLGCGSVTEMMPEEVKTATNTVANNSESPENLLREKTGVPECDQLIDLFADESKNKDDDYITRAAKEFFFNKIRQSIKENIDQNKNNPKEMAKNCSEFKKQIEAQMASERSGNTK